MIRDYTSGTYKSQLIVCFYLDTEITNIKYENGEKIISFSMSLENCEKLNELFKTNIQLESNEIEIAKQIRKKLIADYYKKVGDNK